MTPRRIHWSRHAGLPLPDGAVLITRTSRWGNPYRVEDCGRDLAVARFAADLYAGRARYWSPRDRAATGAPYGVDDVVRELAGRDLACACPPGERCHGDILLAVANGGGRQ